MRVPSHPTLVRRMLDRRLKQLVPSGPILAASLMQVNKPCGQPSSPAITVARCTKPTTSPSGTVARHAPFTCPRIFSRRSENGCRNPNVSRP